MEFAQYIRLFRKWSWLFILAAFAGGGINFILNTGQRPDYIANTIVSIGRYIDSPNPDSQSLSMGFSLVDTYAQLVTTSEVLQGVIDALDLNTSTEFLRNVITTTIFERTSLLDIQVIWDDPVLTVDIANEVADQLILQSPTNLTQEQQDQINFLNGQITSLNQLIENSRVQLAALDAQLQEVTDASEIIRLTEQRNTIIDQITSASATIADFSNSITSIQQRTNALEVVERARSARSTGTRGSLNSGIVGAAIGIVIAFGIALVVEYMDDTIRTTEEAVTALGLPVFGAIMRYGKKSDRYEERLLARLPPMSPVAEAYRNMRTNLLYNTKDSSTKKPIYIVTSPGPEEGKSLTSANLATAMALAGLRVLLIDADLRRPKVHEIFGLDNQVGLTTLLFADPGNKENLTNDDAAALSAKLRQCLQDTFVPELRVITSGFTPSNPSELLGSTLMKRWVDIFRKAQNVDAIVIDTPPCLVVADSAVLAATVDANVVLVINSTKTRRAAAQRAKAQFEQLGVKISGLVLNQVNPREESYGYGYNSYYYYYGPSEGGAPPRGLRRLFASRTKQT